ncbi:MAG: hypothetical protein Q8M37_13605 [Nevskia sp.]|nr:hypothetical protein [Nevskia sp.]
MSALSSGASASSTSRRLRGFRTTVLVGALVVLAGCSAPIAEDLSASPGGGSPTVEPPAPATDSGWTTLGTRALASSANVERSDNGSAVWTDYDPPAEFPKVDGQPLQYITMRDGVRLAAYVTLPADAAGNAAPGPFSVVLVQTS